MSRILIPLLLLSYASALPYNHSGSKDEANNGTVAWIGQGIIRNPERSSQLVIGNRLKREVDNFEENCLRAHNQYRAKHGVQPLKINPELTKVAQDWANQLAASGKFQHRPNNKYGENLYWYSATRFNEELAIKAWYDEIKLYSYGNPGFSHETGHFTQVIWKGTSEVGCARAIGQGLYIVCNYNPPGNYLGRFPENVLPLSTGKNVVPVEKVTPAPQIDSSNFEENCLRAHNQYRAKHGVKPLKINPELTKIAQDWANGLAGSGNLQHRPNNKYGENLFWSSSTRYNEESAVKAWYDEITLYSYSNPGFSSQTGHFTQVIWKDTSEVGCARATGQGLYIVCNYNPPGNYLGRFPENVLPPNNGKDLVPVEKVTPAPRIDSSTRSSSFEEKCLLLHNQYRAKHGVSALTINPTLTKVAQDWADRLAASGQFQHRPNNNYGENLYWSSSTQTKGESAVKAWYDEISLYDYGKPGFSHGIGHFTQIVWKDTKEVGCAQATGQGLYIVCNYNPPGNYIGRFPENVLPPRNG